jgi:ECF transporter S component (folate family)
MINLLAENFTKSFNFSYIFSSFKEFWYAYTAILVIVVGLVCLFIFKKQKKNKIFTNAQKITYVAVLTALCAFANIFDISISQSFQVSLVATVGFIAGYIFGANWAFAACFIGDLLGALINPHGPYSPIINFATALWGLIPGIIFHSFKWNKVVKLVVSYFLGFIFASCLVNTFGIWFMYGNLTESYTFWAYLWARMPSGIVNVSVNLVVSFLLMTVATAIRNYVYGQRGQTLSVKESNQLSQQEQYDEDVATTEVGEDA